MKLKDPKELKDLIEYVHGITIDGPSGTHFKRSLVRIINILEELYV